MTAPRKTLLFRKLTEGSHLTEVRGDDNRTSPSARQFRSPKSWTRSRRTSVLGQLARPGNLVATADEFGCCVGGAAA